MVEARGDEEIEYDGEMHTAANLFDSLKEGYYGKSKLEASLRSQGHDMAIKIDRKIVKYHVAEAGGQGGGRQAGRAQGRADLEHGARQGRTHRQGHPHARGASSGRRC